MQLDDHVKQFGDLISISTVVGTLVGLLPSLAALLTIIWTLIRIYESDTIQRLVHGKKPETGKSNGSD